MRGADFVKKALICTQLIVKVKEQQANTCEV